MTVFYQFSEFQNNDLIRGDYSHGLWYRAYWPRNEIEVSLFEYNDLEFDESSNPIIGFSKEIKFAEKLQHRNLLGLLGYAIDYLSRVFLIMEKCEISLAQYLKKNESLGQNFAISIAKEIVSGLIYLEVEANYEIQNLNTMNIWMDENIPKFAHLPMIQTSLDIPSPKNNFYDSLKFIDPNFIRDPDFVCDKRSNIFSLGITLASLAGISVYDSDDAEQFVVNVYNENSHWNADRISAEYVQLCQRCCASDPDLRPSLNDVFLSLANLETRINHVKTNASELDVYSQERKILEKSSESILPSFINLARIITESEYDILESTLKVFDKFTRISGNDNTVFKKIEQHLTVLDQTPQNFIGILKKLRFLPKCACLLGFFDHVNRTDLKQAFYWYKVASDGKDDFGANQLGYCYSRGIGIESDKTLAFELYQVSAKRGHPQGVSNSARRLYEQDAEKAFEMYHSIAKTGYTSGQFYTGSFYETGHGVTRNLRAATYWFKKAAEGEHERGTYSLISNLRDGYGTNVDVHEAIRWCRKATRNGSNFAGYALKRTFRVM
ncbi:5384_t:CDS:2 [Ambispora leptoticha]|uniref:5384_t:CDS:1 n=1 Tax=Ambispora leptoticha TaxID=144679 RepID=A0A9N9A4K8_9GLOM|nr:5384_t:CDS:2 [Ambispora leptoticha]